MKKFLAAVLLSCVVLTSCATPAETQQEKEKVPISFLCKHEELIMKLAFYDSTSIQLAAQYFSVLMAAKECVKFSNPQIFVIEEVLAEYKDTSKEDIMIVKARSDNHKNFEGYVLLIRNIVNPKGV